MKTIYIKYNPYKVETEIRIDDELVKENSQLNVKGKRLQEWVENLPEILVEECNDSEYKIIFHGTALDFDDVQEVIEGAKLKEAFNGIVFEYEHQKGQEVEDKELRIKKIFEEIQQGPFEELKGEDVKKAFEQAQNQDFPVNVVATMSAGKSTLINALLGKKLMPSSQEACTATISEIQDNDKEIFEAQAFDKDGNLCATSNDLNLETMKEWNSNEKISKVEIKGDIPFVNADDTRLILMDTPGPNNSRDKAHQETTMRALSESSKTLVLYILNATQLGINDDNNLLNMVSESMKVGGKQSKDRFIFVVNKLDEFFNEDDDVESALDKVRKYLEDKGIDNPNIYPASALTALNIRTILKEERIDVNPRKLSRECRNAVNDIDNMLDKKELHLEQYTLNGNNSLRKKIKNQLENAEDIYENEDESEGMKQLGLIHSGIIPIEEAIKIYTEKYSKTLKIKNIVDTFQKKLETQRYFTNLEKNIAKNKEQREKIVKKLNIIQSKINDGQEASKYKTKIDKIDYTKQINAEINRAILKAQEEVEKIIDENRGTEIPIRDVESKYNSLIREAEFIQTKLKTKLDDILNKQLKKQAQDILNEYKQRLESLTEELNINDNFSLNVFSMIEDKIDGLNNKDDFINSLDVIERDVVVGERKVSDSTWWKPWTWGNYHMEDVYEKRSYYDLGKLTFKFFSPFQVKLNNDKKEAKTFVEGQSNLIKSKFKLEFDKLDKIISEKLEQLKMYAIDKEDIEHKIVALENDVNWLENISKRVNSILDI